MRGAIQSRSDVRTATMPQNSLPDGGLFSDCSGLTLSFVETQFGHVLVNPIGDNVFIPTDEFWEKIDQGIEDLLMRGEAFIEV